MKTEDARAAEAWQIKTLAAIEWPDSMNVGPETYERTRAELVRIDREGREAGE